MRVGIRKAYKKYPCFIQAFDMFLAVEEVVNKIIKYDMEYEGQMWELSLLWEQDDCKIRQIRSGY